MTTTKSPSKTKKAKRPVRKVDPNKKPFAEEVAERIIKALEAGTAPWQKSWKPGRPGAALPHNPVTGSVYKGINSINLMMSGYSDTRWMTYKQAQAQGAQVRSKEKATTIQFWSFDKTIVKKDESGKPIKDANGDSVKVTVRNQKPSLFTASVFNAQQIDGLAPMAEQEDIECSWESLESAEKIVSNSGAIIDHVEGDRAFYRPSTDKINMPLKTQFPEASGYYSTLLHEIGHWTGHASRLDRDLTGSFGSASYAKEELRAEIASMIIGDTLGIGHDPGDHVAYVASWLQKLKEDPLEIFRAAADAEKIKDYVLGLEHDKDYTPKAPRKEADQDLQPG